MHQRDWVIRKGNWRKLIIEPGFVLGDSTEVLGKWWPDLGWKLSGSGEIYWVSILANLTQKAEDESRAGVIIVGEAAAITQVSQKRGMFNYFCGCRVSLSQSCFRHTEGVALSDYLYSARGIYVQLGTPRPSWQGHFSLSPKWLKRYQNDLNHCWINFKFVLNLNDNANFNS